MSTKERDPNHGKPDLCHGYAEIGEHLGLSARQAKHLSETCQLPTFKLGRIVCALRSKLDQHIEMLANGGPNNG